MYVQILNLVKTTPDPTNTNSLYGRKLPPLGSGSHDAGHVVENRPLPMKHWSISKLNSLSNNTFSVVIVESETITLKSTNSISIPPKHFCYILSMLLRWYDLSWAQLRNYDTDTESELTGMLLALLSRADLRSMEDCGGTTDGLAVSYPARQCCTNSTHSSLATCGHVIFDQSQDRIFDQSQDRIRRSNYPTMYKGQPSDCLSCMKWLPLSIGHPRAHKNGWLE